MRDGLSLSVRSLGDCVASSLAVCFHPKGTCWVSVTTRQACHYFDVNCLVIKDICIYLHISRRVDWQETAWICEVGWWNPERIRWYAIRQVRRGRVRGARDHGRQGTSCRNWDIVIKWSARRCHSNIWRACLNFHLEWQRILCKSTSVICQASQAVVGLDSLRRCVDLKVDVWARERCRKEGICIRRASHRRGINNDAVVQRARPCVGNSDEVTECGGVGRCLDVAWAFILPVAESSVPRRLSVVLWCDHHWTIANV